MLETEIAYLAGLVDGEGTITLRIRKQHNNLYLRVVVYNTNEDLLEWCLIHFGGRKHKIGRRQRPDIHKQEWAWYKDNNDACELFKVLLPYLVIKKAKAQIAIDAWENRQPTKRGERRNGIPSEVLESRKGYIAQFRGVN